MKGEAYYQPILCAGNNTAAKTSSEGRAERSTTIHVICCGFSERLYASLSSHISCCFLSLPTRFIALFVGRSKACAIVVAYGGSKPRSLIGFTVTSLLGGCKTLRTFIMPHDEAVVYFNRPAVDYGLSNLRARGGVTMGRPAYDTTPVVALEDYDLKFSSNPTPDLTAPGKAQDSRASLDQFQTQWIRMRRYI